MILLFLIHLLFVIIIQTDHTDVAFNFAEVEKFYLFTFYILTKVLNFS